LGIKFRHHLRKNQYKAIINEIKYLIEDAETVFIKSRFEMAGIDNYELVLVDGEPLFMMIDGKPFITLRGALKLRPKKRLIRVDAGAIPFVIKGADIMRPGIISTDPEIQPNDIVIIVDDNHGKPLAIGYALVEGNKMIGDSGKVVKTFHRVGDKLWNLKI
jgi:PUA-domain protein